MIVRKLIQFCWLIVLSGVFNLFGGHAGIALQLIIWPLLAIAFLSAGRLLWG